MQTSTLGNSVVWRICLHLPFCLLFSFVSVCRLGPRGQERRTQAALETEGKLQAETLGNEQREHADRKRLCSRTNAGDR